VVLLSTGAVVQGNLDDEARQEMSAAMPAALVDAFFEFFRGGTYDDSQADDTAPRLPGRPLPSSPTGPAPMRRAFR
jgi:hypothetical protein